MVKEKSRSLSWVVAVAAVVDVAVVFVAAVDHVVVPAVAAVVGHASKTRM
jgi:hypothetical protein